MKATGIVRRIDELGRVVIPKEIRRTLRIKNGDPLEIYTTESGGVILKKYSALKDLSGQEASILSYIDPLVAVLVSVLILGESMTVLQVIGGALILGFTLWNEKNS